MSVEKIELYRNTPITNEEEEAFKRMCDKERKAARMLESLGYKFINGEWFKSVLMGMRK